MFWSLKENLMCSQGTGAVRKSRLTVMAYSHCKGTGPGQIRGMAPGAVGTNMLYRNVHTFWDRGRNQDPLFPIVLVQFPVPVPDPIAAQCEQPITLYSLVICLTCNQSMRKPAEWRKKPKSCPVVGYGWVSYHKPSGIDVLGHHVCVIP